MAGIVRETSVAAYREVERSGKVESQREKLLRAALLEPGTARELGVRAGVPEHDATTRCAQLKREGLLEEVGERENEQTGRRALVLGPTELVGPFLEGRAEIVRRPSRRRLVEAVVEAARGVAQRPGSLTALAGLQEALGDLDGEDERGHGGMGGGSGERDWMLGPPETGSCQHQPL